ncbi:DEAD/DEAH box helicase family protein [Caldalkalibacillus salinus]|uniref:DEAD/DEAH box helicase family protein n=1 Tax=Caldalkalibacillus salinus TaxID=2803787 RepID=UPI0019229B15|nr:DEAD/DEAH box helicase family protein [Caldalkalibacillus salinus]
MNHSTKLITNNLIEEIKENIEQSTSVYVLVSFVMKSGVELLSPHLIRAMQKGTEIKILCGDYLYVTQPEALQVLTNLNHHNLEVRMWQSRGVSFHPKSYIFQRDANNGLLVVGSSNLSHSALKDGHEWNLSVEASTQQQTYEEAIDQFMKLFYHEQTLPLNKETLKQYKQEHALFHQTYRDLAQKWTEQEELSLMLSHNQETEQTIKVREKKVAYGEETQEIKPRPAQKEALEELKNTLEEGYDKALVVMATGLGKTYLVGFFALNYERILFIAHREEILYQAQSSFERIMPRHNFGIYNAKEKNTEANCIFASIFTLANKAHLEKFDPTDFDLIIIDEFHHAAAHTYQKVIDYFDPRFLLGITATPDRMDNKDVYAICDGNVAYRLHFLDAIQNGWLCPFEYHGVYDEIDYSQISWLGKKYDEKELLEAQVQNHVADNIYNAWKKHKQSRTIAFCSSVKQADYLARYFQDQGVHSLALHSKEINISRNKAIQWLETGEIEAIFTVDLFNEGVDIPSVDTLLFVRPTESLTVFTQQIGRGLRLAEDKEYCTVIDLIGNYKNADIKLSVLSTEGMEGTLQRGKANIVPVIPDNCKLNLDTKVINLLEELKKKRQPRKESLREAYFDLKQELGQRPSYLEFHLQASAESHMIRQEFKSYIGFLSWLKDLTVEEEEIYHQHQNWFREVERTSMAKSYKMIVLQYMLNKGVKDWLQPVTPDEVSSFFHQYLTEKEYRKRIDFSDKASRKLWEYNKEKISKLITDMPMTKWSGSSKGLVTFEDGLFKINIDVKYEDLEVVHNWTQQICEYRLHAHFERKGNRS